MIRVYLEYPPQKAMVWCCRVYYQTAFRSLFTQHSIEKRLGSYLEGLDVGQTNSKTNTDPFKYAQIVPPLKRIIYLGFLWRQKSLNLGSFPSTLWVFAHYTHVLVIIGYLENHGIITLLVPYMCKYCDMAHKKLCKPIFSTSRWIMLKSSPVQPY